MKFLDPWQVKCQRHTLFIPIVTFSMHFCRHLPPNLQMQYLRVTAISIKQTKKRNQILCTMLLKRVRSRRDVGNSK